MNPSTSVAFDSHLGGEYTLPDLVNVQEFCKGRIEEILMLTEALKESPFRGQAFQRLPKHMRRRQMSHNIKRLPRKLRISSLSLKDEGTAPPKRPSRSYRRRPKNLLLEYNRRQRQNVWLETHIWHAKRFHMTSKWGYRLPEKPSNKSFRACYRASTQHCLLIDLSFYNCIEMNGPKSILLEGLQQCVSPNCGLTFAAKMFENGSREGSLTLYHPNSYPYKAVGEVSFLWKPVEEQDIKKKIWIFTHPILYDEIIDIFKSLFSLTEVDEAVKPLGESSKLSNNKTCKNNVRSEEENKAIEFSGVIKENVRLGMKHGAFKHTPKFINKDESISMCLLKDNLNRFRLTGPLSLAIISQAFVFDSQIPMSPSKEIVLNIVENNPTSRKRSYSDTFGNDTSVHIKKVKQEISEDEIVQKVKSDVSEANVQWWHKFYNNEFHKKCLENQANFFQSLIDRASPSDLPPKIVLSVIIKDPRLTLPSKRLKSVPNVQGIQATSLTSTDPTICYSPLWDPEIRDEVCKKKISTAEINNARSSLVVPGTDVRQVLDDCKQARVPLIIIQRTAVCGISSSEENDVGSGFDIIAPPGWAMPVWLSLIYRGARTGGLRESESLLLETKNLSGYLQPDSIAGEIENLENYRRLRIIYFKRPPNKRPNFIKLGVVSPFYFPWKVITRDWSQSAVQSESEMTFHVLRDKKKLEGLNELFENLLKMIRAKKKCDFVNIFEEEMDCLVPVSVESSNRGTPKEYAMLCLPTLDDIREYETNKACPTEGSHIDANEEIRKLTRSEHLKVLKSIKRKRKKEKLKSEHEIRKDPPFEGKEGESCAEYKTISSLEVEKYAKKIESLWLQEPEEINSVIHSCSRTLIGYIVSGGFCYSKGRGLGLGYVTLRGLLYWLEKCRNETISPVVLFRNTHSANYRFCNLRIHTS